MHQCARHIMMSANTHDDCISHRASLEAWGCRSLAWGTPMGGDSPPDGPGPCLPWIIMGPTQKYGISKNPLQLLVY